LKSVNNRAGGDEYERQDKSVWKQEFQRKSEKKVAQADIGYFIAQVGLITVRGHNIIMAIKYPCLRLDG